jgi:hypothetical protein
MLAAQRALTGLAAPALLHEIPGAGVAPSVVRAGQSVPRGRKCQARVWQLDRPERATSSMSRGPD